MSAEEQDEFPIFAEDQEMPRQHPSEVPALLTTKLPKQFLGEFTTDEELADHFVRSAGYHLLPGARCVVKILPVLENSRLDTLVGETEDCEQLYARFQSGAMNQCQEIVIVVRGEGNRVLVPDCSTTQNIPVRVSSRSGTKLAREFHSGQIIEVSKTFSCESVSMELRKFYAAKVKDFVIRCVPPYTAKTTGKNTFTFKSSSLLATHLGFLGSGMTVRE